MVAAFDRARERLLHSGGSGPGAARLLASSPLISAPIASGATREDRQEDRHRPRWTVQTPTIWSPDTACTRSKQAAVRQEWFSVTHFLRDGVVL